jgi:single-strand selective monofunctional uracil DNA glycosylase
MWSRHLSPNAKLLQVSRDLSRQVESLVFGPPVAYVYNPLSYAAELHEAYVKRFGGAREPVLLVGMNPGPFGMAQTGIPFGDAGMVRDFLGLHGTVGRPAREHPKRPVLGLGCPRGEVSGRRLWGWVRDVFKTPRRFFEHFFVVNYCPLAFLEESGRNRTPDKLPAAEKGPLFAACDEALRRIVALLRPTHVIGVGAFAVERARAALRDTRVPIGGILHPSPASPLANRDWASTIEGQLRVHGIVGASR